MNIVNPKTISPAKDWQEPTAEDFKKLQEYAGWSGPDIAKLINLKIDPSNGSVSAVQKWRKNGRIQFSVWALLCVTAKIATLAEFGLG